MKKLFKTYAVAAIALLTASMTFFISCNKETESTNKTSSNIGQSQNQKKSAPKGLFVGTLYHGQIICGVDVDMFSDTLFALTQKEYVAESVEIIDSGAVAELHLVLFNITESSTESIWLPLEKYHVEEGRDDYYYSKALPGGSSGGNNTPIFICKKEFFSECDQYCKMEYDRNNNPVACKCVSKKTTAGCKISQVKDNLLDHIGRGLEALYENIKITVKVIIAA